MISELVEMLGYCRPAFSQTEEEFHKRFLHPLGTIYDDFGNAYVEVGQKPNVMWSCHTDTVHHAEGRVPILVTGNTARVQPNSGASCLGADCTTGVWLMMEMIRAKVPGSYVFHRSEEIGCQGSNWIARNDPHYLAQFDACVAFDRYGTTSIITHQMGDRGCSEAFAASMIKQLPGYKTDDGGSFTDSYTYFDHISECTNISVGYYSQHGQNESQNLSFAQQLRDWMVKFDPKQLVFERDPSVRESKWAMGYAGNYGIRGGWSNDYLEDYYRGTEATVVSKSSRVSLTSLVQDYPREAADLLEMCGVGTQELMDHINQSNPGFDLSDSH